MAHMCGWVSVCVWIILHALHLLYAFAVSLNVHEFG